MPVPRLSSGSGRQNDANSRRNSRHARDLPRELDVRDEGRDVHDVEGPSPTTWYAMSDVAAPGVARLRLHGAIVERLQPFAQLLERRPARIDPLFLVHVRLDVQVLATDRAQAGAVGLVQRIFSGRSSASASRAHAERSSLSSATYGVRQLVDSAGVRRLVLARRDRPVDHRVAQAAVARPVEAGEERRARRPFPCARGVIVSSAGTVPGTGRYRWPPNSKRRQLDLLPRRGTPRRTAA